VDTRDIKDSHRSGLIFRMSVLEGKKIRETDQKDMYTTVKENNSIQFNLPHREQNDEEI
jgi:hypothetical protein